MQTIQLDKKNKHFMFHLYYTIKLTTGQIYLNIYTTVNNQDMTQSSLRQTSASKAVTYRKLMLIAVLFY